MRGADQNVEGPLPGHFHMNESHDRPDTPIQGLGTCSSCRLIVGAKHHDGLNQTAVARARGANAEATDSVPALKLAGRQSQGPVRVFV